MPRQKKSLPAYLHHKPTGQAYVRVTVNGTRRVVYLGKYDSPESRAEYRRVTAELETSGPTAAVARAGSELTVNEVLLAFLHWAATYYRHPDGKPTNEVDEYTRSARPVRKLYGHTLAKVFGPRAMAAVRNRMVAVGWCRSLVNRRTERVKRIFKWAAAEELAPVTTYQALRTLEGLRKGRTQAAESKPVLPADPRHVEATLPHLDRHTRAMVELQRLTGMRPGEVCKLTAHPNEVNFTQPGVSPNVRKYANEMANGEWLWRDDNIIRVLEVDGQLVSYDNRRLAAARMADLPALPYQKANPEELFPGAKRTWAQQFERRRRKEMNLVDGEPLPPTGQSSLPRIKE